MTNLQRLTGKIFGETATATGDDPQIGQFGSALAGTYIGTTDVATIQNLSAWSNGFIDSVTPNEQFPPLPEMTGFGKVLSHQYSYLLQKGIAEWDSETTYYTGDLCKGIGVGIIYESLIDNNINNSLTDTNSWKIFESNAANKELSNLSFIGNSRLHALKSYEDSGELLTDAEGLADVKSYAHSTFDLSKFTKVGSPVITDDGIASGFSSSNYITKSSLSFGSANFDIYIPFKLSSTSSTQGIFQIKDTNNNAKVYARIEGGTLYVTLKDSTSADIFSYWNSLGSVTINTDYVIHIQHNGTTYNVYLKTGSNDEVLKSTATNSNSVTYTSLELGLYSTLYLTSGSIDLKQFSITVNGAPVFSGNRTGIDTIKPDNYTVVGTPTISDDGIMSIPVSSGNYINIPIPDLSSVGTWKISTNFKVSNVNTTGSIYSSVDSSHAVIGVGFVNSKLKLWVGDSTGGASWAAQQEGTLTLSANTEYKVDVIYTGTNYQAYIDDVLDIDITRSAKVSYASDYAIKLGSDRGGTVTSPITIDLNAFKIYADGDLVYQPCLKIPYTLSKTGSKIVDSYYRSRVSDMYDQFGYAPYYTLSDTDFTLPQGEIYGMFRKNELQTLDDLLPDFTAGIEIQTTSFPYTTPSYGWMWFSVANFTKITIDGVKLADVPNAGISYLQFPFLVPVKKGQVFTYSAGSSTQKPIFYPMKGVN